MNSPYVNHLRLSKGISKYMDLKSHQMTLSLHYDMLKEGIGSGKPLIFTEVIMPSEIFHAMDISPLFLESLGSFLASINQNKNIIKEAENMGISADICAYHKCAIGALESGYIPIPQGFVHSSYWCDDMIKVCDYLGYKYNHKPYIIDIPYNMDEDAISYVANQFFEMSNYLSKITNKKLDMERLNEAIKYSNEARKYWVMAQKLREESPCLMYGSDSMQMLPMLLTKLGHEKAVRVLKTFYNELLERREKNSSPVGREKYRLLWLHFFPFYDLKLMNYIEKELGAVIAFEENCSVYWDEIDEKDPFRGLALKLMQQKGLGSSKRRVDGIVDMVKNYKIDGVVHFSQMCCRPFRGSVPAIKEALNEEGVPFLELPGEVLDSRNYAEGQLRIRIEAFIEMLNN